MWSVFTIFGFSRSGDAQHLRCPGLPNQCQTWCQAERADVLRKFGKRVPAQVSYSSSDSGSKLRGWFQNSPRVASKRDIDITKLNYHFWSYVYITF
ncbi:hypothetical protein AVEN_119927-1 [Araneus ventricosus]|uniref:Uncharacterized protein n=1 Tax=Araneus ventricosus TaxID=182803 RepID=A0A4Y2I0S0_ARAVE|nr:hypothetical protein AVEN_119927-1 [Araneus ventricosus]